ncbi:MAG TPA: HAD-IIIC family phosphatase [Longimicrobiaceae bacterium]|nr:HAD-IIIC family phosphatase [Longimicrobiaceae bacterium]
MSQTETPAATLPTGAGIAAPPAEDRRRARKIKVVVWDLDNTVWDGVLLEDPRVSLKPQVPEIMRRLDERGILQSVASKNDHDAAMAKLRELGLDEYFLYPQINWSSKAASIEQIRKSINIGIDTVAFVDDQPFEREEVAHTHPEVLCIDTAELDGLLDLPEMNPEFITEDSRIRRRMYMADIQRNTAEADFVGPTDEFLATLGMRFTIARCGEDDLQRAEELTVRTNQLNTTGYTYSYEELNALRQSPDHLLLVASLEDRYGTYGKIGLALVEKGAEAWTLKLLLMSCRVMSRGVGTIMMNYVMGLARDAGVRFRAEFKHNGRNRMMYVTYKFGGFREVGEADGLLLLEHDLEEIQPFPDYVDLKVEV